MDKANSEPNCFSLSLLLVTQRMCESIYTEISPTFPTPKNQSDTLKEGSCGSSEIPRDPHDASLWEWC